ncbi:hypothetical protein IE077_002557 [Cardiosporidium cionae]|uniref:Nucleolar protein 16 n=1 Tax=Cardiosporidium cionae TaxID=476202 RepID=A0ABQ7JAJ1_9APIC|nr:hypothetical protein IE077_002557 [Cardiosporidium cionae]|eukprot:KAF8821022.1 hypothetical protein IE077_002557 [Cardiosporidium cionae]
MAIQKRREQFRRKVRRVPKTSKRRYLDLQKQHPNPIVRKKWSNKRTLKQNLESLTVGDFLSEIPASPPDDSSAVPKLGEREVNIVEKLSEKHGTDLLAMARDIKTNRYQWTTIQCEKKLKSFKTHHLSAVEVAS